MPIFIKTTFIVSLSIWVIIMSACQKQHSLNEAVFVPSNKEFEKVINRYQEPKDSLKLRAAYYLLENAVSQNHYSGEGSIAYRKVFERMDSLIKSGHGVFNHSWDSLQRIYPAPSLNSVELIDDLTVLKADFFIENIESSFKAWDYPWAKNMSFSDFCKYILPYKLENEEPEIWKSKIQYHYSWLLDSMKNDTSAMRACLLINQQLKKQFYINARVESNWDLNYSDLLKMHTGKCSDATRLTAYVMRAMGLPVTMDFTPLWANKDIGHQWNALVLNDKNYFFVGTESDPGANKIAFTRSYWIRRKRAKIYRHVYSKPKSLEDKFLINNAENYVVNADPRLIDVTSQYIPIANPGIFLKTPLEKSKIAGLCVFNNRSWRPVFWSKVGWFGYTTFKDMGTDVVYLPAYIRNGEIVPAGLPFLLDKNGEIQKMNPGSQVGEVKLFQKYPQDKSNNIFKGMHYELVFWDNGWSSLGKKTADTTFLTYPNVPENALLWLRNLDEGKQERIFTYNNNSQVWW